MAQDPEFITYLLNPDDGHDCYFLVGNSTIAEPEKIGAVKKMLLAHSAVLRNELQYSKIAEKGLVRVEDVYPDTFRNLLRYVYGYDTTLSMSFEDADNLLYVAEKYMMQRLKDRLANRLMVLISYKNICSLMENPACYRHLELNCAITKILQNETDRVLISPQFVNLSSDAFLKILEQEISAVSEIELWRAALKWVKHRVNSEDSDVLRAQLTPHLQHLRLCTLSAEELYLEVAPTRILSSSEFNLVGLAIVSKKQQNELKNICNKIHRRTKISNTFKTFLQYQTTKGSGFCNITLLTKNCGIELLPFELIANNHPNAMVPEGLTYLCECKIEVTRITDYVSNTSTEDPVTVMFHEPVRYGRFFKIPITHNGHNLQLLANNKYSIKMKFNVIHNMYVHPSNNDRFEHKHFTIGFCVLNKLYYTPFSVLEYRTVS